MMKKKNTLGEQKYRLPGKRIIAILLFLAIGLGLWEPTAQTRMGVLAAKTEKELKKEKKADEKEK
ncbi:MAG: hypothetical protein LBR68_02915, partial [Lachnoclostridium sp.]|nr:hypothetical protein [Lachnoclostridium sp.]